MSRPSIIHENHWSDIYSMYISGQTLNQIQQHLLAKYSIEPSEFTIRKTLEKIKDLKKQKMAEFFGELIQDDATHIQFLQTQLEEIMLESRFNDMKVFFMAADRLINIFKLKVLVQATTPQIKEEATLLQTNKEEWLAKLMDK